MINGPLSERSKAIDFKKLNLSNPAKNHNLKEHYNPKSKGFNE